jgi:hypothetical protein
MQIIQVGDRFTIADVTNTYDKLPVGNYLVKYDSREGFYLSRKESFQLPSKIYGDHSIINRWKRSYEVNSEKNMGIVLSGLKGTGKTITAQKYCIEMNLPVIMLNDDWHGPDFVDFITNPVWGEFILFIDEFEKIYTEVDTQTDLLSLMDGNYATKIIFLLTVNNFNINEYLINRLNRVKYRKDYTDLDEDIMEEVIDDLLIHKHHKDSIFEFFTKLNTCTFDLLVGLIKEVNLFNESAIECGKHLNLKVQEQYYEIFEIIDGKEYLCDSGNYSLHEPEIYIERNHMNNYPKMKNEEGELVPAGEVLYYSVDLKEGEFAMTKSTPSSKSFFIKSNDGKLMFKFKHKSFKYLVF